MKSTWLYVTLSLLFHLLISVSTTPVRFEDDRTLQDSGRALQHSEEGRVFHPHAIKKRKKKKLLQCLLNLQRENPQVDGRTLFFNYLNLEYSQHGNSGQYNDEYGGSGGNNCFSQFGGGSNGGGGSGLGGIGEGINHLGSLVGQVGQTPGDLVSSIGDGIKPVFENSERYLNRYIIRPLYRSLRPLYRLF